MNTALLLDSHYLKTLIDALPSSILVVDQDLTICDMNPAAKELFGIDSELTEWRLCGEIIHCLHAIESIKGCGTTKYCKDCVLRNSVQTAWNGEGFYKKKYSLKIQKSGEISEVHMLVTSSLLNLVENKLVLLAIEDITEITLLKQILPICASCKKIRNDDNYWEAVSDYLRTHTDLEFTHSICPDCACEMYPEFNL